MAQTSRDPGTVGVHRIPWAFVYSASGYGCFRTSPNQVNYLENMIKIVNKSRIHADFDVAHPTTVIERNTR